MNSWKTYDLEKLVTKSLDKLLKNNGGISEVISYVIIEGILNEMNGGIP